MNRPLVTLASFAPLASWLLVGAPSFAQSAPPAPPPALPASPASPASPAPPEPPAMTPRAPSPSPTEDLFTGKAPPAAPPTSAQPTTLELTTLRLLKEKGVVSQAEYDSAVRDMGDSVGEKKAGETGTVVMGKWATTFYGFVEADQILDTTQSFNESAGNAQVAYPGTYAGQNGRVQFGVRNSRIGFRMKAPEYQGIRTSAMLEMDFLGNGQTLGTGAGTGSEANFYSNALFRVRHMNLKIETPVVDVLFGQYWQLFGWQSVYHPNTVEIQGIPGQVYSRTAQLRISKTVKTEDVIFEAAVAAMRPPNRDSQLPEGQAGLRLATPRWTGITTAGSTATSIQPLSIALTGDARKIRVPSYFKPANPDLDETRFGTAMAVDAFVPVVPAKKREDAAVSLNGEFATGYGTSDLYTGLTGGAPAPQSFAAAGATAPAQNVDTGVAVFDATGGLHLVQWTSYLFGAQVYLPGGKWWVSANYSHSQSANLQNGFVPPSKVRVAQDWWDVNLFTDLTPAVRLGVEYANFNDVYGTGWHAINHRGQISAFYLF